MLKKNIFEVIAVIPVCEPTLFGNELKYVKECVETNWISSGGSFIEKFENNFAKFCDVKYGAACCNGTVALHLALSALNLKKGDEVIIPDFTIISCANAALYNQLNPVFVDVEKETWCIDPNQIEAKITERTKAIMPVHIYGQPCKMDEINHIAKKNNLFVIEDAAEAHGALYKGKKVGSLSDVAAFSFYSNKIITTGEGGMVVSNNQAIINRAKLLRNLAFIEPRFKHNEIGYNYRLTNIAAAIGCAQMEKSDQLVDMRIKNANEYSERLKSAKWITLPPKNSWSKNVYWMYGILIDSNFKYSVKEIIQRLAQKGIETRSFFYPLHSQPVFNSVEFKNKVGISGDFPISNILSKQGFYLPSSSHLTIEQIEYICQVLLALE